VRRSGIFQFRRRWPTALTKHGAPAFLSVSLRTDVLSDAVKRSALLLTLIEAGERDMIAVLSDNPVCETRTKALIQDLVRRAVARMLDRQESDAPEIDSAGHLAQLAQEKGQIIAAQRNRNWELSAQLAASVAPQNGLSSEDITQPVVARQVLAVSCCDRLNH
jgi:hypothetical protein